MTKAKKSRMMFKLKLTFNQETTQAVVELSRIELALLQAFHFLQVSYQQEQSVSAIIDLKCKHKSFNIVSAKLLDGLQKSHALIERILGLLIFLN
jgi:hypothetical protein